MSAVDAVVQEALTTFVLKRGGPLDEVGRQWVSDATTAVVHGLQEMQPDHYVVFDENGDWSMQHSMACRLDGLLFDCPIHKVLSKGGSGGRRGAYVAILDDTGERVGLLKA